MSTEYEKNIRTDERQQIAAYIRANIVGSQYALAKLAEQLQISNTEFGIIDQAIYNLSVDIECGLHAKQ